LPKRVHDEIEIERYFKLNVPQQVLEVNPSAEPALKPGGCEPGSYIQPLQSRFKSFLTLFDGSNKLGYI